MKTFGRAHIGLTNECGVELAIDGGATLRVAVLEPSMCRVRYKPASGDDHPAYDAVRAQGGFVHDAQSAQPVVEQFWDGVGSHLDFTHPAAIVWWQQQLRAQVLDYGIDVGWNDNNEYAVMDDAAACHGFGTPMPMPMHRARPLHGLLMTRATFEAKVAHDPGADVFTVTRGGPPGLQRYAQTWTGDNTTSWETLRWNIRTGLQMSLSGMFNIGHDVGGFVGPSPDPEMLPEPAHGDELVEGRRHHQRALAAPVRQRRRGRRNTAALHADAVSVVAFRARAHAAPAHHPPRFLRLSRRRAVFCGLRRLHAG
jgi:hypothetical protein